MTTETLRSIVKREPFERFRIHLSDGRKFEIRHPDYVGLPPEGVASTFFVWTGPEAFEVVSVRQVTGISTKGQTPGFPKRKRRDSDDSE
jgi:hypothetical protein